MPSRKEFIELRDAYLKKKEKFEMLVGLSFLIGILGAVCLMVRSELKWIVWLFLPLVFLIAAIVLTVLVSIFKVVPAEKIACQKCDADLFADRYKVETVTAFAGCWRCKQPVYQSNEDEKVKNPITKAQYNKRVDYQMQSNRGLHNLAKVMGFASVGSLVFALLMPRGWIVGCVLMCVCFIGCLFLKTLLSTNKFAPTGGYLGCGSCKKSLTGSANYRRKILETGHCPGCGIRVVKAGAGSLQV